jgi:hypothetical protein
MKLKLGLQTSAGLPNSVIGQEGCMDGRRGSGDNAGSRDEEM